MLHCVHAFPPNTHGKMWSTNTTTHVYTHLTKHREHVQCSRAWNETQTWKTMRKCTHIKQNKIHIQYDINYTTEYTYYSEFTCNSRKAPFMLCCTAWHMCVAIKRHMWHKSSLMITIMENAYICGAHICARHHIRTLYFPSHLTCKPPLWGRYCN